jgi:hypothetical protein
MSHALHDGDFLLLPDSKGFVRFTVEDAAALVAFGQAGSEERARQQRIRDCTHNIRDILNVAGDTCCRGCGLVEKGYAKPQAPTPMSERVIGPGDDDYGRQPLQTAKMGIPEAMTRRGVEGNLDILFASVRDVDQKIGELQLKVQKLETGYRDDEEESTICQHLRVVACDLKTAPGWQCCACSRCFANEGEVIAARSCAKADRDHERRNRKTVSGKVTEPEAASATDAAGNTLPLTCTRVTATCGDSSWGTSDNRLHQQLRRCDSDGWHSLTWPDRMYVRVVQGLVTIRVGDGVFRCNATNDPVYIPPVQRFRILQEQPGTELCIDWHHATESSQIEPSRPTVESDLTDAGADGAKARAEAEKAAIHEDVARVNAAYSRQRLADAIMRYLGKEVSELSDRASDSYKREGKTSRTMSLDDEADTVTRIHDDINRIIQETKP